MVRGHKQAAHTQQINGTPRQQRHDGANGVLHVLQQQPQELAPAAAPAPGPTIPSGSADSLGKFDARLTASQRYYYNLKAIRRHDPTVLYVFHHFTYLHIYKKVVPGPDGDPWHKEDVEGTMYVVRRRHEPKHWLLVVNRLGNRNFYRPVDAADAVLDTVSLIQWRCTRHDNEVWAFWSDYPAELAEFRVVLEAVVAAEKNKEPYVPDLRLNSSQVWAQDATMYASRQRLLHGIVDDEPPIPNIEAAPTTASVSAPTSHPPSTTPSRARARAAVPFQEPEDEEDHPTPPAVTPLDALFAKVMGPASPSAEQPRSTPKSKQPTRRAREMLDQLFAPTPPPPPPIGVAPNDVQSPKPQVLNNDVLHMLLGLPATPQQEVPVVNAMPDGFLDDDDDQFQPHSLSHTPQTPKAVPQSQLMTSKNTANRASVAPSSGAAGPVASSSRSNGVVDGVDRAAVIDAASDLLSRRRDPVLDAVPPAALDKNEFGRRLVELIHTDRQFMVDLHQEYLRRV